MDGDGGKSVAAAQQSTACHHFVLRGRKSARFWAVAARPLLRSLSGWRLLRPAPEALPFGVKPEPVLWASRGTFSYIFTEAVPDDVPGHWRAQFDLTVAGADPVEMRLFLRAGEKILSETWLYQYHPF